MIISIIFGLCIWLVLPILLDGQIKKKKYKKAIAMFCRIVGVVIIVSAILHYLKSNI